MKTKIALMTAIMAFSYTYAQENPRLESYSRKIDSIVVSEKSKMNAELDEVDRNFKDKKITSEDKQKQRAEIASKYEQIINEKVDTEQSELEEATKSMVRNAVLGKKDSLYNPKNQLQLGLGGMKMKLNGDRKTPKDYLKTFELSVSLTGANLTSKDEPFRFYSKDSDVKSNIINSSSFTLRYEDQIGGFKSPFFYRIGIGMRFDKYVPKYGKAFMQNNTLFVGDFTKGNLRRTSLTNTYVFVPVDIRFVLNPKYTMYEGVKYLDNKKSQLSIVAGVYGGVRAGSVLYNKYSTEYTKRITERERLMHGMNDLIFGAKFGIGYGGLNLFIQKDFTPAFNDNAMLKKKYGLQIGIEIANINF